jgi:hypothetical protein
LSDNDLEMLATMLLAPATPASSSSLANSFDRTPAAHIEVSSVKNHLHNLDKLKLQDRRSAVRYVKEHG